MVELLENTYINPFIRPFLHSTQLSCSLIHAFYTLSLLLISNKLPRLSIYTSHYLFISLFYCFMQEQARVMPRPISSYTDLQTLILHHRSDSTCKFPLTRHQILKLWHNAGRALFTSTLHTDPPSPPNIVTLLFPSTHHNKTSQDRLQVLLRFATQYQVIFIQEAR